MSTVPWENRRKLILQVSQWVKIFGCYLEPARPVSVTKLIVFLKKPDKTFTAFIVFIINVTLMNCVIFGIKNRNPRCLEDSFRLDNALRIGSSHQRSFKMFGFRVAGFTAAVIRNYI